MANRINGHVKMLGDLTKYIENLIGENQRLRDEVKEWNKDEEIQKLTNQHRDMVYRSVHIMSDKEISELKAFRDEHYNSCKGETIETIWHTGIGSCMSVRCTKCEIRKDITDVENW